MKRIIVDFKKLNNDILTVLVTNYPDGYGDNDIVTFKNQHNEIIECVEVTVKDTVYLIKISKRLVSAMKDYDLEMNTDRIKNIKV